MGGGETIRGTRKTRAAILEAAQEIGALEGWKAVTMRQIAARAGCSAMAAYRHFSSRDALFGALAEDGFQALGNAMRAAGSNARTGVATRAVARAYLAFALQVPSTYELLYGLQADVTNQHTAWPGGMAIGEVVAKAVASDTGVDVVPMSDEVLMLWAGVHGLIALSTGTQLKLDRGRLGRLVDGMVANSVNAILENAHAKP